MCNNHGSCWLPIITPPPPSLLCVISSALLSQFSGCASGTAGRAPNLYDSLKKMDPPIILFLNVLRGKGSCVVKSLSIWRHLKDVEWRIKRKDLDENEEIVGVHARSTRVVTVVARAFNQPREKKKSGWLILKNEKKKNSSSSSLRVFFGGLSSSLIV